MALHSDGFYVCCFFIKDWTMFILLIKDRILIFIKKYPMALPPKPVERKQDYSDAPVAKWLVLQLHVQYQLQTQVQEKEDHNFSHKKTSFQLALHHIHHRWDGSATGARVDMLFLWVWLTSLRVFTTSSTKLSQNSWTSN
ncbi:hypothetical protein IGI04_036073 [Brassica rapa subsp. trilocularis]|uniref:Uncharacterized protein n=1 Tax=Brassica rapa subsp. trilocularis TaxID=1813537 RepID=A0ABQ7LDG0_BRACM|nr:hypothetical protein IGI04_036073 [Brassica rapa subsp. trilocularis]